MELSDSRIKDSIRAWMLKGSAESLESFKKEVETYIYYFPKMAYRRDLECCGEFYLYVTERLETVIRNYPLDAELRFKTWFNYVLRNQFSNFLEFRNKGALPLVGLDECAECLSVEVFEKEEADYSALKTGLAGLPDGDRLVLKWFYLPETLTSEEFRESGRLFGLPLQDLLVLQKKIIWAMGEEAAEIRRLAEKIGAIDQDLAHARISLFRKSRTITDEDLKEKNRLLTHVARIDASKSKLVRRLSMPGRKVLLIFSALFQNRIKARGSLESAKKRLRLSVLRALHENGRAL